MAMTVQLFVGADNLTGEVDDDTLTKVLDDNHDGYTIQTAVGAWKGAHEDTRIVTLSDEPTKIKQTIADLKDLLRQDSIGVIRLPAMEFS